MNSKSDPTMVGQGLTVQVRTRGLLLRTSSVDRFRTRAARALGRFHAHLQGALIRLTDVSGPIGPPVTASKITIDTRRRGTIVVEARAATPGRALSAALASAQRAVRRLVDRRSTQHRQIKPRAKR